MAHAMYPGPIALSQSRFASPHLRKEAPAALPPAVEKTTATKEQLDVMNSLNASAQLAVAQGNALKEEVEKYGAKLSTYISRTTENSRELLNTLRRSLQGSADDIAAVEKLWAKIEQLVTAAQDAKVAMPVFLEKQRNTTSLYHSSMLNDTIRDTQYELNIQRRKVDFQQSLILEHQEAFQDYRSQTSDKLKEFKELQERVSRLTLEKGNFRTEVTSYKQMLEKEKSAQADSLHKIDALQKQLEALFASKIEVNTECVELRKTLNGFKEELKVTEKQLTDRFSAEIQAKADQLSKEVQKTTSLNVMVNMMKKSEATAKMEADNVKAEHKAISEKYMSQAAEHARTLMDLTEVKEKLDAVTINADHSEKENADLKQQLGQLSKLQKETTELVEAKAALQAKFDSLVLEANTTMEENNGIKMELTMLIEKVKKMDREIGHLETENNDLLSKQGETAAQALIIYKSENEKLRTTVDELKADDTGRLSDKSSSNKDKQALQKKIEELEAEKIATETTLEEWTDLAKQSYSQYKELLPLSQEIHTYRQDAVNRDKMIKDLTLQLSASKDSSVGVSKGSDDAGYWKGKYESLLASIG